MQEKHVYEYAIIRLVPRVEREEFINIGVILYCKRKKFLDVKYQLDLTRLQAFQPKIDTQQIEQYLSVWKMICQGVKEGGYIAGLDLPSRFRWLTAARSTMIQSSHVHPGRGADPAAMLSKLFEQYVS